MALGATTVSDLLDAATLGRGPSWSEIGPSVRCSS